MIAMIDDAVGDILKKLEDSGLAENTGVVFTADHGDFLGDHGLMLKGLAHFEELPGYRLSGQSRGPKVVRQTHLPVQSILLRQFWIGRKSNPTTNSRTESGECDRRRERPGCR